MRRSTLYNEVKNGRVDSAANRTDTAAVSTDQSPVATVVATLGLSAFVGANAFTLLDQGALVWNWAPAPGEDGLMVALLAAAFGGLALAVTLFGFLGLRKVDLPAPDPSKQGNDMALDPLWTGGLGDNSELERTMDPHRLSGIETDWIHND